MRIVQQTCVFLACLVMVVSCGGGGTSTGDRPEEQIPISVRVSDSTQDTAQGKTVIFDYSGPELNEEDLTVRVGDTEVPALLSETQIYILLPLSESGETTVFFEFSEGVTTSVPLNIAEAPAIENPEVYVSDQVAEVVSMFESLRDEYPDVWELLEQAQDQIAGLSEDEARELAILLKQNLEPLLDAPEISEGDAMGFEGTEGLEFAAARSSYDSNLPAVSQGFLDRLEECRVTIRSFLRNQKLIAISITALALSGEISVAFTPAVGGIVALTSFAVLVVKIGDLRDGVATILDVCIFKQAKVFLDNAFGATVSASETAFFSESSAVAAARFQPPGIVSQGSEATDRIVFTDGESKTVSVNLDSIIQDDRRSALLEAYVTFRNLLVKANDKLESLGETLGVELSFQNFIDSFPTSLESSGPADTSDFEIDVPSPYLNIKGEITARERGKLTLLFSFPLGPLVTEDYSDFVFVLTDGDEDPVRVSARLLAAEDVLPYDNLPDAVRADDLEAVNALIDAGADLNIQDSGGGTPLSFAAVVGYTDIARALIDAGADLNIQDNSGQTALHYAAEGSTDIARALIDTGADLNIQNDLGNTPLHRAALLGSTDIARALIDAGADLNIQDINDFTPLHYAAGRRYTDIARALIDAGADLNIQDNGGWTALHSAAVVGYTDIAIALIDAGADLNIQSISGRTPLDNAVTGSGSIENPGPHTSIVNALKVRGAVCNITCEEEDVLPEGCFYVVEEIDGELVELVACEEQENPLFRVLQAVFDGDIDAVNALIAEGVDVNIQSGSGWTPLHGAAAWGHPDIARALIDAGADLNIQNDFGLTPLYVAAVEGYTDIARALIDAGADLNIQNDFGWTPLHAAAAEGYTDIARALIDAGANLNIQDDDGWTPLDLAIFSRHTTIVEMLKARGAACNLTCEE